MTPWRVRDFHADDLDAAVRLWDDPAASSEAPAFSLSDLIAAVRSHEPAVVAVVGEELVGAAVATVSGDRAWVMRISLAGAWRHLGIGSAMLGELERRLVAAGVHRIHCLLGAEARSAPWRWSTRGTPRVRGWCSTSGWSRSIRAAPGCWATSADG
jgi:transitional endoplasmic reticulum ATPase